jgi:hypothetical protein
VLISVICTHNLLVDGGLEVMAITVSTHAVDQLITICNLLLNLLGIKYSCTQVDLYRSTDI